MCTGKRACVCLHAYVLQTVLSLCPCVLAHVSLYARLYLCLHTCVWLYDVCASICTFVYACVCIGRRLVTDPYGSGRLQDAAAGDPYVSQLGQKPFICADISLKSLYKVSSSLPTCYVLPPLPPLLPPPPSLPGGDRGDDSGGLLRGALESFRVL